MKPKRVFNVKNKCVDRPVCRLSPIGESGRNSPKDITQIIIRQPSTSTKRSSYDSDRIANNIEKRRSWLVASPMGGSSSKDGGSVVTGYYHSYQTINNFQLFFQRENSIVDCLVLKVQLRLADVVDS